ncbi:hypothetical protein CAPTEDRAFT_212602 [Capitella teleta]|uniref:N-acetyltransferase domain-containing protein n=1 Tax=Capitella teleta TaxID=283909 RepID=R7UA19_CAPTE|nr:hypothetical protein CAPTEDRAFT_212602 [Capitella teleta]|eukprot:ELT99980.1 hypothetical protein CAPTEDRAFT_212602 [Capitella teleta]
MRQNARTTITGDTVVLVPYEQHHVEKYHSWMKSEELQKLTASEPLSLQEEYRMQESWRQDNDKCTFIVLDKSDYNAFNGIKGQIEAMAGDVNLFLSEEDGFKSAEIEIMIAEPKCRGKGMGKEALLAMLRYGIDELNLILITAKIGFDNEASLKLFTKLGFSEISRSEVFKEVTLSLPISDEMRKKIQQLTDHLLIVQA